MLTADEETPMSCITALPDGPLQVARATKLVGSDGAPIEAPEAVFLCRCGCSSSKPFCDGSHARAGWTEDA